MRSTLIAVSALAVTLSVPSTCMSGTITYEIKSYPGLQTNNNANLQPFEPYVPVSGYITTDGHIGTLTAADITGWAFQLGSPLFGADNLNGVLTVSGLVATRDELLLPMGGFLELSNFSFIRWDNNINPTLASYSGFTEASGPDFISGGLPDNPWIIAQIPEPANIVLLGAGVAGLWLAAQARKICFGSTSDGTRRNGRVAKGL